MLLRGVPLISAFPGLPPGGPPLWKALLVVILGAPAAAIATTLGCKAWARSISATMTGGPPTDRILRAEKKLLSIFLFVFYAAGFGVLAYAIWFAPH